MNLIDGAFWLKVKVARAQVPSAKYKIDLFCYVSSRGVTLQFSFLHMSSSLSLSGPGLIMDGMGWDLHDHGYGYGWVYLI